MEFQDHRWSPGDRLSSFKPLDRGPALEKGRLCARIYTSKIAWSLECCRLLMTAMVGRMIPLAILAQVTRKSKTLDNV